MSKELKELRRMLKHPEKANGLKWVGFIDEEIKTLLKALDALEMKSILYKIFYPILKRAPKVLYNRIVKVLPMGVLRFDLTSYYRNKKN